MNPASSRINRLPAWFRQDIPGAQARQTARIIRLCGVNTVCQQAQCPNIGHCFSKARPAFMILGRSCTRSCRFCAVEKPGVHDLDIIDAEPAKIARAVKDLGLDYVVVTSVTRDDLADGGAEIFSRTIESIHQISKDIRVEVLIPDFGGRLASLECILSAGPFVVAHNMETVRRLYPDLRPQADYQTSLFILEKAKELRPDIFTKSSLMLGFGELESEVIGAMRDLREKGCDILTLGQYLAPTAAHYPVKEFVTVEQFQRYKDIGLSQGFKVVSSGPLLRSSYHADQVKDLVLITRG
ncbi:MAG: lipoyl synthase [Candidatus Omnitrophica bacterium]|nr:lipoyl synthase [Candidatus Omnitrophota bacterium]